MDSFTDVIADWGATEFATVSAALGMGALLGRSAFRSLFGPADFYKAAPAGELEKVARSWRVLTKKQNPPMSDIPELVKEIRQSYDTGISRPICKRLEQLRALKKMFVENESRIIDALKADLGRPTFEGMLYDYLMPVKEVEHMIAHLKEYTAPEPQPFNIMSFPSKQYTLKQPYGVSLIIGTWNYPILLTMVPLIGAIAAGNCVVMKPCVVSKTCALLVQELIPKYMDPRVVTVLGADYDRDSACTQALLQERFDIIFFTGSPSVGRVIMEGAAKHLTPCILELGGKNPVFVDKDADINLAAKRTVWGAMLNAGQQCIRPDFVLCHKDVMDKFNAAAAKWVKEFYGENPKDGGNIGRVVGDKQMLRLIDVLANHGGKVICGGGYVKEERYIAPTVLCVSRDSPAMAEETFGPILLVTPVDSMDEAIQYVNARPKPLSLYIFSSSTDTQNKIVYNTSSGGVTVNATLFHAGHPSLPFGGVGASGMGNYHGQATFDTFAHRKPVLIKPKWHDLGLLSDPMFLYPPWNSFKVSALKSLMRFV
eukprot:TRINITY_DN1435_c0_g1::TRINITY_DN1435_c0_g1_i1::g.27190::m.27190 TRINITY_DN1435_c0_g1::TRINITY_DN1435_c0_g1_i1::g.27190  ORF type:complete len:567 (-),score=170.15,sp/P30838/AL3A1_HUMAN/43.08/1e-127,Aldedh/PF00171.17/1.4e-84 TRINITY_DN1435_c0_g1_i1:306-1925(-)